MAENPNVFLAHGGSGSAATMVPWADALTDTNPRLRAATVPATGRLPMKAERAVEVFAERTAGSRPVVVGGISYGGRVASMLAARDPTIAGLVLLSYPLHPPGKIDQQRVDHLPAIRCPVLFLSGESDPFARMDLLRAAVTRLESVELYTYPGVGHALARGPAVMADAVARVAAFSARALGL
ncbi:MAG: alpha/beta family hydrolase [Candidatus Dormibacteria bacterium]